MTKEQIAIELKIRIDNLMSLLGEYWESDKELYYFTQGKIAGYRGVVDMIENGLEDA